MANVTYELICIRDLLSELHLLPPTPMRLHCDNQAAIHIIKNPIFHECVKHIEVDFYLICQKVIDDKIIETRYVLSANKLVDLLRKSLRFISDKLDI